MPEYTVWTNATEKKMLRAHSAREAASKYHREVGQMPEKWDGTLMIRDDQGEEWTFRHNKAA